MYEASSSCSVHEEDRRYGCHTHTVLLAKVAVNGVCGEVCVCVYVKVARCVCVGRGGEIG